METFSTPIKKSFKNGGSLFTLKVAKSSGFTLKTMSVSIFLASSLLIHTPAFSIANCPKSVGSFVSIQNQVDVRNSTSDQWNQAELSGSLCEGDVIRVGEDSRAALQLINDAVLRLDENTTMRLLNVAQEKEEKSVLDLVKGMFQSFSRKPRTLEVNTPYLNGLIEGTEFVVRASDSDASLMVIEGVVKVSNPQGSVRVQPGDQAEASKDKAPMLKTVVRPLDAVQWALHYRFVISVSPEKLPADEPWSKAAQESMAAYAAGDLKTALAKSTFVPESVDDSGWLVYRASLKLSVGRLETANQDIERVLKLDLDNHDALALKAIIAVTQNQNDQALALAEKAVSRSPESATALIALSFAQQANFDLAKSLASVEKAVAVEPDHALAWARLAELYASFGDLDKSLDAANQATTHNPNLARTHTVLGFAFLSQLDGDQAAAAFEKAISLDSADPMPRLGLGLTKISEGNLAEGRAEIDVAVSLDPSQSILRSYLGKAYYEEKRSPLEEQQFEIAKKLDPKDPTPWFYDAITKQTTNRPVEALKNLNKAIELNDNRAVYRSRLLLDSDLAARSASLGKVYGDLGFQELALKEGFKSVDTDPSNHSAHRLLADSYAVLSRHEIARVSELLQSQLLQPLNMTPIQPQLAESNLKLLSSSGPSALSFNEYNPVFASEGLNAQMSLMAGTGGESAQELVISGLFDKFAFSLGGMHAESDGFREGYDQNDKLANAFIQFELSPDTSIQAEYRYRETEKGDLLLRFFPVSFYPNEVNTIETHTYRLGLRHNLSPNSILLGSLMYQEDSQRLNDPDPVSGIELEWDIHKQNATSGELQHIYRGDGFNLTMGAGYFDVDGALDFTVTMGPPPVMTLFASTTNLVTHHANVYSYGKVMLTDAVDITLGLSYDKITGDFPGDDQSQVNPKLGLTWELDNSTTLRMAAFKTLKRTLVTNQTLEPTQIAGFSQFYDDYNVTEAWRYGIGLDRKLSHSWFAGVEVSQRDLDVPYLDFGINPINPPTVTADWEERLARFYLLWTPNDWMSLRAEYQYEEIERDDAFPEGVTEADTHRVPLGFNVFWTNGLSLGATTTYYRQDGEFGGIVGPIRAGSDSFWITDMAVSWRLPNRHGSVSVGAANVFDEDFKYYDLDLNNASIQPERSVFVKVTIDL